MKISFFAFFIVLVVSEFSHAQIYRCIDDAGNVLYKTKPGPGCVLLPASVEHDTSAKNSKEKAVQPYRIVKVKDLSMKAISKPLSSYSSGELRSLPRAIRKQYQIVVPSEISKNELKAAMKHLVEVETSRNPDIDAVAIFAFDRVEDIDGMYTFGKMEWCPDGEWGGVTPYIASTNDRSSYRYVFQINEKVGNFSAGDKPTKEEYTIYDNYKAILDKFPDIEEDILKSRFAKNLGISEEQLDKIIVKVLYYRFK